MRYTWRPFYDGKDGALHSGVHTTEWCVQQRSGERSRVVTEWCEQQRSNRVVSEAEEWCEHVSACEALAHTQTE